MHWTDFITLALITILLSIVIQDKAVLTAACFILGAGAGVYRGLNPHPSRKKDNTNGEE